MHLPSTRPNERPILEFGVSGWYTLVQTIAALILIILAEILYLFAVSANIVPQESTFQVVFLTVGFVGAIYLILNAVYLRLARHYFLTTERVIQINGWLNQQTISVDYPTVTDLTVYQDVFERFITHTGSVSIDTAGGPKNEINLIHVAAPIALRDQILELVEKARRIAGSGITAGHTGVRVAPSNIETPIKTNPQVVDSNNDGLIDDEAGESKE